MQSVIKHVLCRLRHKIVRQKSIQPDLHRKGKKNAPLGEQRTDILRRLAVAAFNGRHLIRHDCAEPPRPAQIAVRLLLLEQAGNRFRTFPLRFQYIVKIVAGNFHIAVVFMPHADTTFCL